MASTTGEQYPGTAATVDRSGNTTWDSPTRVTANNGSDTVAETPTDYLVCSNFGFAIPTDDTILGVIVRVHIGEAGSGGSEFVPQLISAATPTLIGSAKSAVTVSGSTKTLKISGNGGDVWGATLTPAIVNNSGFGVALWSDDSSNDLEINYVTLEVFHESSGSGEEEEGDFFFLLLSEE